ncbi:hypothetical protein PYW07_002030 [Mythimna separata]|uniref:Gem-associated protein 8 n=1 Tax=Mythimna separata TaxID=271217 RepID=A0AAD8DT12_MYTSE|nr:hypothetical protein PYW07_002030 [Mythimna separata]
MFFQSPDEEPNFDQSTSNHILKSNAQSRRQKKLRRKNRLKAIRKRQHQVTARPKGPVSFPSVPTIPITMSSWAENYTKAATWQLKHEVAYWKSKAKALEHENMILHRTIRLNSIDKDAGQTLPDPTHEECQYEYDLDDLAESEDDEDSDEMAASESETTAQEQFEVSEEYIQFLRDNQVYRESARLERERIKAKSNDEDREIEEMEAGPAEPTEDQQETLKKLYGDRWERIAALEMSLKTQFISTCDRDKPAHWPNIPFNFNFS